jgi:hypothetical protein
MYTGSIQKSPHIQTFKLKMRHINLGIPQALKLAKNATIPSMRKSVRSTLFSQRYVIDAKTKERISKHSKQEQNYSTMPLYPVQRL